jgi:hypothetical protein
VLPGAVVVCNLDVKHLHTPAETILVKVSDDIPASSAVTCPGGVLKGHAVLEGSQAQQGAFEGQRVDRLVEPAQQMSECYKQGQ